MFSQLDFTSITVVFVVGFFSGLLTAGIRSGFARKLLKILIARNYRYNRRYEGALTSLMLERTDEGVDTFVRSIAVNTATFDVHLSLGALHRKRGDYESAVKIHENLLYHPSAKKEQRYHAQFELGEDYYRSGILDRAEEYFKELSSYFDVPLNLHNESLIRLLGIYQEFHDWLQAIDIAGQLTQNKFSAEPDVWRCLQAQFCCEIVQKELSQKCVEAAESWLRKAKLYDANCVRIQFLEFDCARSYADEVRAVKAIQSIATSHSKLLITMLEGAQDYLEATCSDESRLSLYKSLYGASPSLNLLNQISKLLVVLEGPLIALRYLLLELSAFPALSTYSRLIEPAFLQNGTQLGDKDMYQKLELIVLRLLQDNSFYLCSDCGFKGRKHHWVCPQCHHWNVINPQLLPYDSSLKLTIK
ncbi:MAG: lipopolysaccharide biosynthesis regulator YciM [Flavobacteriales bacterium]|jgi:lipopolysaccharide biosynthesis regulator YciM